MYKIIYINIIILILNSCYSNKELSQDDFIKYNKLNYDFIKKNQNNDYIKTDTSINWKNQTYTLTIFGKPNSIDSVLYFEKNANNFLFFLDPILEGQKTSIIWYLWKYDSININRHVFFIKVGEEWLSATNVEIDQGIEF